MPHGSNTEQVCSMLHQLATQSHMSELLVEGKPRQKEGLLWPDSVDKKQMQHIISSLHRQIVINFVKLLENFTEILKVAMCGMGGFN